MDGYQLQCAPQPVESDAILSFELQEQSSVTLKILNGAEEIVRVLLNENLHAGRYRIPFEAATLPSGSYTAKMIIGTQREVSICNASFQVQKTSHAL